MTWADLIDTSLRAIGWLGPGRGGSVTDRNTALVVLNAMLDSWGIDRRAVYAVRDDKYALTAGKRSYTIGSASADINASRPVRIEAANLVFTDVTPNVRRPITIINYEEWARIRTEPIADSVPLKLYYDAAFVGSTAGLATIYLWPGPSSTWSLELLTWQQFTQVSSLTATVLVPPGYLDAIRYNLAVRLGEEWRKPASPMVLDLAQKSRDLVDTLNASIAIPSGQMPAGALPQGDGK